jgi:Pro-kumamolisin, activation domain/Bacterial Ig-like domain (group 3)
MLRDTAPAAQTSVPRVQAPPQVFGYGLLGGRNMKTKNLCLRDLILALAATIAAACLCFAPATRGQQQQPPAAADAGARTASIPARITEAVDERNLLTLKGNVHPLARAEFDQGVVSDGLPLHRMLLLLQRSSAQEAALQKLLDDQQDKSSPNYHAWLTPTQFGQQFGPADADIQAVTSWLQSHGFNVANVSAGRTLIEFSGTATQVRSAFHTEIHNYMQQGQLHTANVSDPQIPAALAPVVAGPVSLNNFPVKSFLRQRGTYLKSLKTGEVTPLLTFPAPQCTADCYAVGPADFATIYNTQPLLSASPKIDGTGQTIAIVGESDIDVQDVTNFRAMFELPQNFSSSNILLNGPDPGFNGSEGESDLDVQWAGAVAPGATIDFVVSGSTETTSGIFLSATYIVENNLAGVMSESFGACEQHIGTLNQFHNLLWEQAAAQGITVMVSAGDGGSAGCDNFDTEQTANGGVAVSGFASTPFNLAVGGTDFDDAGTQATYWNTATTSISPPVPSSALSYIPEVPWNDSCARNGLSGCNSGNAFNIVAGSGGVSTLYPKPSWQTGSGVPSDQHRDLPDISLFASIGSASDSFYIMCQSDALPAPGTACNLTNFEFTFQGVGGTSASSPAFAGIMALVNQKFGRQGNANYVLYALAKKNGASCNANTGTLPASTCTFYDVTKGNNSVPCSGGSLNCSSKVSGGVGILVPSASPSTPAYAAGAGYDLATGLGSVNAQNLVNNWSSVSFSPSVTTLSATVNGKSAAPITGLTHGQTVGVTANVAAGPGGSGTPTGQVGLLATPNPTANPGGSYGFAVLSLTAGAASSSSVILPGGNYNLTAHYQGDGTFGASDSPGISVTISPEPSKTLVSIPVFDPNSGAETGNQPTSLVYGSPYIARVDVGNGSVALTFPAQPSCSPPACPSGKISWTDAINGLAPVLLDGGSFVLNANGYTEDQTIQLSGGTHVLAASYLGDGSYQPSVGTYSLTVTPAPTASTLIVATGLPVAGQPCNVTFSGVAQTLTGAAPTGTVTFFDGSTQVGNPVPVTGTPGLNGASPKFAANATLPLNNPGNRTLTAKYTGDANYAASTSAPNSVAVLIPTSLSFNVSSTSITYGTNTILTATLTTNSKGPAISGGLLFFGSVQGDGFGNVTQTNGIDANGNATIQATVTTVLQASQTIFAGYSGDPNYAQATSQAVSVQVNIPDFTLGPAGGITVAPVAGQPGSGQFTITPVTQTPSTVTLALSPIVISGYTISLGSPQVNLNGSPVSVTLSMTPVSTASTNLKSSVRHAFVVPSRKRDPWPFEFFVAISAAFLFGLGTSRTRRRTILAASLATVLACTTSCGGGGSGGNITPPPPPPQAQPTTITLATTNAKVGQNQPFTITATVSSSSGQPLTGTITFFNFGTQIFTGPIASGQSQTGSGYINNPGLYAITASYSGDAKNMASTTAAPLTQVITGTFPASLQANTGVDVHSLQVMLGVQ